MKILLQILFALALCLGNGQFVYAEESTDDIREIVAEGTYQMKSSDTPAIADAQALLQAKRNALAQVYTQPADESAIANLPEYVFSVSVLDTQRSLVGNTMQSMVQIKVFINMEQLPSALKEAVSLWGGPAQYYCEEGSSPDDRYARKTWVSNNGRRQLQLDGQINLETYEKQGDKIVVHEYWIKGNKYLALSTHVLKKEKLASSTETLNGKTVLVEKFACQEIYDEGKFIHKPQVTRWIDPETNLSIKETWAYPKTKYAACTIDKFFKNHQVEPQDPALFQIPSDYIKYTDYEAFNKATADPKQPEQPAPGDDAVNRAIDSALGTVTQQVIDRAVGGIFGF